MPNHEPENGPPEQPQNAEAPAPEASSVEGAATPARSGPVGPRDLAQRVWGSWPSLPTGAAPAAAPAAPPEPPLADDLDVDEQLDPDLLQLEDRLSVTEERLDSLARSTEASLRTLGETIRSSTADLPAVIERVVEQRLNAVGDALLKLADLRARLQEETGEAVKGLRASFQALEERLAETTQKQVQASIERLVAEVRATREHVAGAGRSEEAQAALQALQHRVAELPTRGDFAAIRGAIGTVASSVRSELEEVAARVARIEAAVAATSTAQQPADEPDDARTTAPEGGSVDDLFDDGPMFDSPER